MNIKNLLMWGIIALLVLGLFNLFQNPNTNASKDLPFSTFITEVDKGNVNAVDIRGNEVSGTFSNGARFKTYVESLPKSNLIDGTTKDHFLEKLKLISYFRQIIVFKDVVMNAMTILDSLGNVQESNNPNFKEGDTVIVTGYDLGMNTYGGFGQYISIPATWAISLPNELSEAEAMSIGTAGLTAGLCVRKLLQNDLTPDSGDVLVTGASGGVGSVAVMVLSKLGFNVVALTGKQDQVDYLESLGASSVIIRSQMEEQGKPLQKGIYQGGVDTVGGNILSNFISQTSQRGAITCCGNVASDKLETSIFPFILRGVTLIGIDSAESLLEVKKEIWNNFSNDWKIDLEKITKEVFLESLSDEVEKILKGNQVGRIRVNLG